MLLSSTKTFLDFCLSFCYSYMIGKSDTSQYKIFPKTCIGEYLFMSSRSGETENSSNSSSNTEDESSCFIMTHTFLQKYLLRMFFHKKLRNFSHVTPREDFSNRNFIWVAREDWAIGSVLIRWRHSHGYLSQLIYGCWGGDVFVHYRFRNYIIFRGYRAGRQLLILYL